MYGDFAIIEVEIVMTIGLTMFHDKQFDIEVNTRFYVGCCYYEVVDIFNLHIFVFISTAKVINFIVMKQ